MAWSRSARPVSARSRAWAAVPRAVAIRSWAYAAATALHVRLHALLAKQDPALAELDQQAYDACWSRQLVEAMFQRFKTELDAGRLDAAAQALDELNLTVPESPDAERARKLYREKVTQPPKE